MRARDYLVVTTLLAGIALFAGNIAAQRLLAGARLDFTAGRLYTLSEATRARIRSLAEPVDLTLVYSRRIAQDYPAIQAHAARVRELLAAYESGSGGRIRVREIDPKPFSEAEDEALAAGVLAVPTDGPDPLYFGIIGRNMVDDVRLLPFLAPERDVTLEYDLTRMIDRLDNPDPPRVGIITSLPGLGALSPEGGYLVLQDIARSFEIVQLPEDFDALPDDLDVLLLAHAPALSTWQEWLVDQFIMRTGRAIFLVDPAARIAASEGIFATDGLALRSDLGRFATAWGVTLAEGAVADAANALPVPTETSSGRVEQMAHPLFFAIPATTMSRADIVTADLMRQVNFGAPGALVEAGLAPGLRLWPLITTGPSPSFINAGEAARDMSPRAALAAYRTEAGALTLAARLTGELRSAFPGGPPSRPPADEGPAPPAHLARSEMRAEIILIADADFVSDDFYVVPDGPVVADNGALLINALDSLAGGGELSRLRSRAPALRPMTRIERMRERAEEQYLRQQDELQRRLAAAEERLAELQSPDGRTDVFARGEPIGLASAEASELSRLREEIVALRAGLRTIERDYRRNIDQLEGALKALNVWGPPLVVALAGVIVWRRQKRPRSRE